MNKLQNKIILAVFCVVTLVPIGLIVVTGIKVFILTDVEWDSSAFDYSVYDGGCLGDAPPRQKIEEMGGYKFPTSAKSISANSIRSSNDCTVYVSFEIADDDLHTFLKSTLVTSLDPCYGRELEGFRSYVLAGQEVNWGFDSKRMYFYGEGDNGSFTGQSIVIDRSSTEAYTAYIITHME